MEKKKGGWGGVFYKGKEGGERGKKKEEEAAAAVARGGLELKTLEVGCRGQEPGAAGSSGTGQQQAARP